MNVFITGGSGFIGKNLKEQLDKTCKVFAPASGQLDLLDEQSVGDYLKSNNFDVVIHTATWNATKNSPKDTTKVLENNLRMFFNIARCSGRYGKMLYFGSGAEYDRRNWIPLMKEDYFDSHVPADDYGLSKYIMAKYTEKCRNIYNLRLFGVFGKYEDWEIRFISNACCKTIWDLPITIKQNVFFDYLFVDDLKIITEWFMEHESVHRVYNICTGKSRDLVALAKIVLSVAGKKLDIRIDREGLGREYSGDNSKLLGEMEGFVFKDMTSCIEELYRWYLENKNKISREKLLSDKY